MKFAVRFTPEAAADIERLQAFLLDQAGGDTTPAEDALEAIHVALALLESSPFACRRAPGGDRFLRELLIGFGATGYVALFKVVDATRVSVIALRHQREDDYS